MNKTAAHRSIARRAALTKVALDNVGSEIGGLLASPLSGAAIGAVPGALVGALAAAANGKSIGQGIGAGALGGAGVGYAGSSLANLGGVLTAIIRKRRTKKQQQEHDSKSHWENFIPGVAAYNYTKRKGRVLAGVGEPDEKKAAEAAFTAGFCKAAETLGVDPGALYKQAGVGDLWWRALPDTSRGALVYHGLADPGTLLPLVGTIGGIHQVAAALNPRREASKTERAIRGAAGLGLTAGGAYAMLDNDAKQAVRNAVYRLVGKLSKPTAVAKVVNTMAGGRTVA